MRPTLLVDHIWEVDLDVLARLGVRGIILDLDNTIVDWNESCLRPEVECWIAAARAHGLRFCIVSNALRGERVKQVAAALGVPAILRAGKPMPSAFRRGMGELGTEAASTCAIGDQVFTDLLGASWAGLCTVLVQPLTPRESPHTRLIRLIERPLRRRWAREAAIPRPKSRSR